MWLICLGRNFYLSDGGGKLLRKSRRRNPTMPQSTSIAYQLRNMNCHKWNMADTKRTSIRRELGLLTTYARPQPLAGDEVIWSLLSHQSWMISTITHHRISMKNTAPLDLEKKVSRKKCGIPIRLRITGVVQVQRLMDESVKPQYHGKPCSPKQRTMECECTSLQHLTCTKQLSLNCVWDGFAGIYTDHTEWWIKKPMSLCHQWCLVEQCLAPRPQIDTSKCTWRT